MGASHSPAYSAQEQRLGSSCLFATENLKWRADLQIAQAKHITSNRGKTAVSDADGTLWAGDVGVEFLYWLARRNKLPDPECQKDISLIEKKSREMSKEDYYKWNTTVLAGLSVDEIEKEADLFFQEEFIKKERIYAPQQHLIKLLQENKWDIWIVSASNRWVVAAGAKYFGIPADHVIGVTTKIVDGKITSIIEDFPFGPEKVHAIKKSGIDLETISFAQGDSKADLPMIQLSNGMKIFIAHDPFTSSIGNNIYVQYFPLDEKVLLPSQQLTATCV